MCIRDRFLTMQDQGHDFRGENEALRARIKRLEETRGAVELDEALRRKDELEDELLEMRTNHEKESRRLRLRIEDLEKELDSRNLEIESLKSEPTRDPARASGGGDEARRTIAKQQRDLQTMQDELETVRSNEKKLKSRIKQLELELENALRRGSRPVDRRSPYTQSSPTQSKRGNSFSSRGSSPGARGTPTNQSRKSNDSAGKKTIVSPARKPVIKSNNYIRPKETTPPRAGVPYGKASPKVPVVRQSPTTSSNKKQSPKTFSVVGQTFAGKNKGVVASKPKNVFAGESSDEDIKRRINSLTQKRPASRAQKENIAKGGVASRTTLAAEPRAIEETVDVGDIDSRLNKLQELLRIAKS
eukprot:TRINITY_DN3801_c0_g1_i3.p1 TRINITY_DN3801_c0_g1~~TRINITY_DN3801_c0_g1_i3.p1  ORF type:complete len:379 (-),score=111.73 TRINITY_DN3801_c0_g1_i3:137-1213(-)